MPLNRRLNKENVVHLQNGLLLSFFLNDTKKISGKWMQLEKIIIQSEVTQIQKDKHGMHSLISGY